MRSQLQCQRLKVRLHISGLPPDNRQKDRRLCKECHWVKIWFHGKKVPILWELGIRLIQKPGFRFNIGLVLCWIKSIINLFIFLIPNFCITALRVRYLSTLKRKTIYYTHFNAQSGNFQGQLRGQEQTFGEDPALQCLGLVCVQALGHTGGHREDMVYKSDVRSVWQM